MKTAIKGLVIFVMLNLFISMISHLKDTKSEIKFLKVRISEKSLELKNKEEVKTELEIEARNLESLEVIEKIARNQLNMKKNGEKVYRIVK